MDFTYFRCCPDYYSANFSSEKYFKDSLEVILTTEDSLAIVKHDFKKHDFKKLSIKERIWNFARWLFGFGDRMNPVKVNGEFLKFIYRGVLQGYLKGQLEGRLQPEKFVKHSWLLDETKVILGELVKKQENERADFLKEKLITYYEAHRQALRPSFWKRRRIAPRAPLDPSAWFGQINLHKAALAYEKGDYLKAVNQNFQAIIFAGNDRNKQKDCFEQVRNEMRDKSPSGRWYFQFVYRLIKDCIKEQAYEQAEIYLKEALEWFGEDEDLKKQEKNLLFKQEKWGKLIECVNHFIIKLSSLNSPSPSPLKKAKLAENINSSKKTDLAMKKANLAIGIAEIFQEADNRKRAMSYLKKAKFHAGKEGKETIKTKSVSLLKKMASKSESENNLGDAITYLREAIKCVPEDKEIKQELARLYVIVGDEINTEAIAHKENGKEYSKSPLQEYEQAFLHNPDLLGPHIKWLIEEYKRLNLLSKATEIINYITAAHPEYVL